MAYTKATLVQKVRRILGDTPAADTITSGYTAAGLTLAVADATIYDKGDILEFKTDGDQFLVNSVSGTTITMLAAGLSWNGSTNANHSSGATFFTRPTFSYLEIVEAIEAEMLDSWPYLWKAVTNTITPIAGQRYYDAATSTVYGMDIIDAIQKDTPGTGLHRYGTYRGYPIEHLRGVPAALATSTVAIYFPNGVQSLTNTIVVRVRATLTATLSGSDYADITQPSVADAIAYMAAARLVENSEVPRVTQQDTSMGDASVVPGRRLQAGSYLAHRAFQKKVAAQRELMGIIPPAVTGR
jgi:hypothetical protein